MSSTLTGASLAAQCAPVSRRVRAYFAPVNRSTGTPTLFDAAQDGRFDVVTPPAPWVDLGWCSGFVRKSESGIKALNTGAPATVQTQTRTGVGATVEIAFLSWGKLQMALCSGSEHMNLLATASGTLAHGSGGAALTATSLATGSSASSLVLGTSTAGVFNAGDLVVVDVDYAGQTGFVGAGASGAYLEAGKGNISDVDFIRRVSLNVGRISVASGGVLTLETPLLAGAPTAGMKVSRVLGFCDREGGQFFHEWSALFCVEGEQGDRVLYHYPRLQTTRGSVEMGDALPGGFERLKLAGAFRALPVTDAADGARVVCFRSYVPASVTGV